MLAEFEATVSLETRNKVDHHKFYWRDDKLFSTLTNRPVEESMVIYNEVDRQDWIGFQNIQSLVGENSEGVVFWLSPPNILRSPQAKITIYEFETVNGQKETFNRSVLFDATKSSSIWITNELVEVFSEQQLRFDSEESVRITPIFTPNFMSEEEWTRKIEQIIGNPQWEEIATGEDKVEYQRTLDIIQNGGSAPMGKNPASCPPGMSPSAVLSKHSLEGKFVYNCGNCGAEIKRIIHKGYQCPKCEGVYEGC